MENVASVDVSALEFAAWDIVEDSCQSDWTIHPHPTEKVGHFTWKRPACSEEFLNTCPEKALLYEAVHSTNKPNYKAACISLEHGLNMTEWRSRLTEYPDKRLCDYM